jgi:DNA-binding CsgD family transcriptional regulator
MGVVDELLQARVDYERGDWAAALDTWSCVEPDDMDVEDLRGAAAAAYLLGRREVAIGYYQRAFRLCERAGDPGGAVRCAFHVAMSFDENGEPALAAGWAARAERLVGEMGPDPMERGYAAFLRMYSHIRDAAWPAAAEAAAETTATGRQHGNSDLVALGLCASGRIAIYGGRVSEGLAMLDEAMAGVAAGEVSPAIFGNVYCTAIEGCQEIADFARVAEWTSALHRWCSSQPGLVAFTGQCSVHRGQVMRVQGAWSEALDELEHAIVRYQQANILHAVGQAECERGDLLRLRGEYVAAETAYARAAEYGYDPQPGLALLWLAHGRPDAATAAVRRLLGEESGPVHRARLLPGAIDALLAVGAVDEARTASRQLDEVAAHIGSPPLLAMAAYAAGSVELAAGDAAGALPYLRKARQLWARAESPYEGARVRLLTGRALAALGDEGSAHAELEAARATFRALGAAPAEAEAERLLAPAALPAGLTAREVEVLRLVAAGRSNAAIAAELVLSEKTVARHLSNTFAKLGVGSRTAAAAYAFEHDLV